MKLLYRIAFVLVVIGALNWGLVGLLGVDIIFAVFGNSFVAKVLYGLIGVSGIYIIIQKLLNKK